MYMKRCVLEVRTPHERLLEAPGEDPGPLEEHHFHRKALTNGKTKEKSTRALL